MVYKTDGMYKLTAKRCMYALIPYNQLIAPRTHLKIARVRTVAVVVPSPAISLVLLAT
jgi:hypothetical protein